MIPYNIKNSNNSLDDCDNISMYGNRGNRSSNKVITGNDNHNIFCDTVGVLFLMMTVCKSRNKTVTTEAVINFIFIREQKLTKLMIKLIMTTTAQTTTARCHSQRKRVPATTQTQSRGTGSSGKG